MFCTLLVVKINPEFLSNVRRDVLVFYLSLFSLLRDLKQLFASLPPLSFNPPEDNNLVRIVQSDRL